MSHRELYPRIGGFIKKYFPIGYEDEELSYRMRKYGYQQAICGKSWVRHDGGATINNLCKTNKKYLDFINENRASCIKDIQSL